MLRGITSWKFSWGEGCTIYTLPAIPNPIVGMYLSWTYLESLNEKLDLSTFRRFPEVPRDVEESGLKEEDEADPLVVLVVLHLGPVLQVGHRRYARVGCVGALLADPTCRDRECGVDPAVGVHNTWKFLARKWKELKTDFRNLFKTCLLKKIRCPKNHN